MLVILFDLVVHNTCFNNLHKLLLLF